MKAAFVAIAIVGLGVSFFLIAYGICGGLINKKILNDGWRKTYDTGRPAIQRGWFYIVSGFIIAAIFVVALLRVLKG